MSAIVGCSFREWAPTWGRVFGLPEWRPTGGAGPITDSGEGAALAGPSAGYNRELQAWIRYNTVVTRTDLEVAWLAGVFEGEGNFSIGKNGSTRAQMRMTDLDIIERVEAVFPSGNQMQIVDPGNGWKIQYAWRVSDPAKVREFVELVMPWLGTRRAAKGRELLHHLDTRPGTGGYQRAKTRCAQGHEYTPENTYVRPGTTHRHCKTCRNIWAREYRERRAAA